MCLQDHSRKLVWKFFSHSKSAYQLEAVLRPLPTGGQVGTPLPGAGDNAALGRSSVRLADKRVCCWRTCRRAQHTPPGAGVASKREPADSARLSVQPLLL